MQAARERGRLQLVTDEVASPTWTVDLASAMADLIRKPARGIYHLTNSGYCSRLEWAKEILRVAGLESVPVEAMTQREFGASYRKPAFSALANVNAASLGVEPRPWQDALEAHLRGSRRGSGAAPARQVNR